MPINKQTQVIWGQNEGYFYLQLRDFKRGDAQERVDGAHRVPVRKKEMFALAAYFTKKKWPNLKQPPASADVAAKANSAAKSIGCRSCHLGHFQGDGSTARLAGQWQPYLHNMMLARPDESRGNNPGMSDLMKATPADDFQALSEYLAGLQIDAYLGHGR